MSQTGLKSFGWQEQGSEQPGNRLGPGWALDREKANVFGRDLFSQDSLCSLAPALRAVASNFICSFSLRKTLKLRGLSNGGGREEESGPESVVCPSNPGFYMSGSFCKYPCVWMEHKRNSSQK